MAIGRFISVYAGDVLTLTCILCIHRCLDTNEDNGLVKMVKKCYTQANLTYKLNAFSH